MASYSNRRPRVADETSKEILAPPETREFAAHGRPPPRGSRDERTSCDSKPLRLGSARRVRGQPVGAEFRMERMEIPNQPRVIVDVDSVPEDVLGTPEQSAEKAKEFHGVLRPHVPIVLKQVGVQAESMP